MSTQTTTTEAASGAEGLSKPAPGDLTYRSEWEASREISHDEAREIARRLIASHFRRTDTENARASIPANPDRDDDLLICSYIKQQARKATAPQPAGAERVDLAEDDLAKRIAHVLYTHNAYIEALWQPDPTAPYEGAVAWSDKYALALAKGIIAKAIVPASLPAALGSGEGTAGATLTGQATQQSPSPAVSALAGECPSRGSAATVEQIPIIKDALIQARGALHLDAMTDEAGKPYGTTTVAQEAISVALAILDAAPNWEGAR